MPDASDIHERVRILESQMRGVHGWIERTNAIVMEIQQELKSVKADLREELRAARAALDAKLDLVLHVLRAEKRGG